MKASRLFFALGISLSFLFVPVHAKTFSEDSPCYYLKGNDDMTQLHFAVCNEDLGSVEKIIRKGINLNQEYSLNEQRKNGRGIRFKFNALYLAMEQYKERGTDKKKYRQIIQLLVNGGINKEYEHSGYQELGDASRSWGGWGRRAKDMVVDGEVAAILKLDFPNQSPLAFDYEADNHRHFKGEIFVSGKIFIDPYAENQTGMLCMHVDEETAHLMPNVQGRHSTSFCFENRDDAIGQLKISREKIEKMCFTGEAKVRVSNFRQYIGESEGCSYAKLVRLEGVNGYIYVEPVNDAIMWCDFSEETTGKKKARKKEN